MLRALENLLASIRSATVADDPVETARALHLATAVLLLEVVRADSTFGVHERPAVLKVLREQFALSEEQLASLYEMAEQRSIGAHDLYSFTERLNAAFDEPRRIQIIERLWDVAYSDGHLNEHEIHLMHRLADLLHVRHSSSIGAKLRAAASAADREKRQASGGPNANLSDDRAPP